MPQILTNANREFIINGHRVVGLASDDRPIEWAAEGDNYNLERGQDGGLYGTSMAQVGGQCTIRVHPSSPTAQWLLEEQEFYRQAVRNGTPHRIYSGTDMLPGISTKRFEGGFLQTPHVASEPGVTAEAMFVFELVSEDASSGNFLPPFSSP